MNALFSGAWKRFFLISALAAPAATLVQSAASSPLTSDHAPRPINSITIAERQSLSDSTMVKLQSGRVASMGTLRAEHRARLSRFSRAASLGRAFAAQLAAQPASAAQLGSPLNTARSARPTPVPSTYDRKVNTGATRAPIGIGGSLDDVSDRTLVPFVYPSLRPMPKDYADFCKAANPTVCVYFPANSTLYHVESWDWDPWMPGNTLVDEDPLIFDPSVCSYSGGFPSGAECVFYYIFEDLKNFKPTGPLTTKVLCNPPATYVFDAKGAVKVATPFMVGSHSYVTGGTEIKCAVQVWIGK
jgi:hypothetical protein